MTLRLPWWACAAAVLGGIAWIPVRLGVSVAWSTEFLRFTYVRWKSLMVVPLVLVLAAMMALAAAGSRGGSRAMRIGGWVVAAGLVGMLAGVIVEFWIFGGLAGDRDGAILGWMIYLFGGVLVHVVGLAWVGIGLRGCAGSAPWADGRDPAHELR